MTFNGFLFLGTCLLDFLIRGDGLVSMTEAMDKGNLCAWENKKF